MHGCIELVGGPQDGHLIDLRTVIGPPAGLLYLPGAGGLLATYRRDYAKAPRLVYRYVYPRCLVDLGVGI